MHQLRVTLPLGNLARCLTATLVAFALHVTAFAPGAADRLATALSALIFYPFLLVAFGGLEADDFERLHAAVGGLHGPLRIVTRRSIGGMRTWAR